MAEDRIMSILKKKNVLVKTIVLILLILFVLSAFGIPTSSCIEDYPMIGDFVWISMLPDKPRSLCGCPPISMCG